MTDLEPTESDENRPETFSEGLGAEPAPLSINPNTSSLASESDAPDPREKLFREIFGLFKESIRKNWGVDEFKAQPLARRLLRLVHATFEQRRLYPNEWRTEFVRQVRTLNSLTGYRDVRALLFEWLRRYGNVAALADPFVQGESYLRRHLKRLADYANHSPKPVVDATATNDHGTRVTLTIDNPETTDRDDALSWRMTPAGIEIGVHIPILHHVVPEGGIIDKWAAEVSASTYMPHRTIPMFPAAVERHASLDAGTTREVLSFYFVHSETGPLFSHTCCETVAINHNSDYDEVERWLLELGIISEDDCSAPREWQNEGDRQQSDCPPQLVSPLSAWWEGAERLESQRLANGGRRFDRQHVDVRVHKSGVVDLRIFRQDAPSHKLISEWMIAANEAAAGYCHENGLPCIYRVQPQSSGNDRGEGEESIEEFVPAQSSIERAPHHDIGVSAYCQITSPLRRYTDLLLQRQIVSHLQDGTVRYTAAELQQHAAAVDETSKRLQRAESKAVFFYKCVYLSQHLNKSFEATICYGPPPGKTVVLTLTLLRLRLFVPLSALKGVSPRQIPPHHSPAQVSAVCEEIDPERMNLTFQIRRGSNPGRRT